MRSSFCYYMYDRCMYYRIYTKEIDNPNTLLFYMKNIVEYLNEGLNVRDIENAWKEVYTKRLGEFLNKHWPDAKEYFDILMPGAIKEGLTPKHVIHYLLGYIDNDNIEMAEEMSMKDFIKDFELYIKESDDDFDQDIDERIKASHK